MKDRDDKTKAQQDFHKRGRKARKGRGDHRMVHVMVMKVAKELAGAYYEHAAHDDQFYHYYPSVKFFVDYEWHRFIMHAKEAMVAQLRNPNTPEAYKQDIYHAILLDGTLPYSQQETQIMNIPGVRH
jgi:hypothetical protein